MIELRVGGVPEHFNLPWHLALESGAASKLGIAVEWRDFPGGSGAMAAALRSGELDAAVLLTEGAVAGVAGGAGFRVARWYTESPLIWGIHVPAPSRLTDSTELSAARYAISRHGSGSHLMAFVHARAAGRPPDRLEFVVVGNLDGAIDAFAAGRADVFFWEKFMTKPLVDSGAFRRIGEFAAPWPAFVLCVADRLGADERAALAGLYGSVMGEAALLVRREDAAQLISERYALAAADVSEWLRSTRWAVHDATVPNLEPVAKALRELGLVAPSFSAADAVTSLPR